ncbi:chemotaxis response regulator protein-glutamate methylesterase [Novosphingobium sp.]|uniref:protein-glutamate methylesterase/protein-glutamine glutaminase n=1 Tax=Novosphingobium sp. TaxID=1874826 RepID=UPI0035B19685
MSIRVLIIDDSATMRALLAARLASEHDIEVVGTAADAAQGREAIKRLDPDVVTLDIEMPGMNGLDFLEKIMLLRPTPVIIVSGSTSEGAANTARALALGAVDCYAKSESTGGLPMDDNGKLANLVREAAQVNFSARRGAPARTAATTRAVLARDTKLIVIGSSTGGVEALQVMLREFPADCPPTMIVQHVNARFAPAIAQTLNSESPAHVAIAEPDMPLRRGHVYLAPGDDRHMMVSGKSSFHVKLRPGEPVSGHRPSVDMLFNSAAEVCGDSAVGVLLTGMGQDGARGLFAMASTGAYTIAQDEATCTVFGMPRAAIALGAAQVVAPLHRIARHALQKAA